MPLIVQKFGGTSLADIQKIKSAAQIIQSEIKAGNKVIVVVSAMAGTTDNLSSLASSIMPSSGRTSMQKAEYDAIVSSGENASAGLMALALLDLGHMARSWQAWQLCINTDQNFMQSKIIDINVEEILQCVDDHIVPVVTGFQGISQNNRITTLGRGGSDTTAAAIAAKFGAARCDIYTDVDGIFSADPAVIKDSKMLNSVSLNQMTAISYAGAKILHKRAASIATKYNLQMRVLSSDNNDAGTILKDAPSIEAQYITNITSTDTKALIRIAPVANIASCMSKLHELLDGYDVEFVEYSHMKITLLSNVDQAEEISSILANEFQEIYLDSEVALVCMTSVGICSNYNIMQKIFEIITNKGINILGVNISEMRMRIMFHKKYMRDVVESIHEYTTDNTKMPEVANDI